VLEGVFNHPGARAPKLDAQPLGKHPASQSRCLLLAIALHDSPFGLCISLQLLR
jgi:hypothetical protein